MVDAFAAGPALDYAQLTAGEFRAAFAVPAPADDAGAAAAPIDRAIETAAGPMRVRVYDPRGAADPRDGAPLPITLYLHGGGFVIGSPDTTDGICRTLAVGARTLVVSPAYRLAPEAPFPAGIDDAAAALRWVHDHAAELGGDAARIAVAGDSSGGNFAAVLAQQSRTGGPRIRHQLLLYPVLDAAFETPSYRAFATGYFLTAEMMRWFWRQDLPDAAPAGDPRVAPLRAAMLTGVPAATIVTAECDVLRDEAEAYAARLIAAGVPVACRRWPGQIHGFLLQQGVIDDADAALRDAAGALRHALES